MPPRIILFGAGDVLADAAQFLKAKGADYAVVAGPRHMGETLASGKTFSQTLAELKTPVRIAEDVNVDPGTLDAIGPGTIGLSIGSPWIFKNAFINRFEGFLYNMHNAPLPRHRGGGGFSWRILQGDRTGACIIHMVDALVDTGPVVRRLDFEYPAECRIPIDFMRYTNAHAVELVRDFLTEVLAGSAPISVNAQRNEQATYWPRLSTDTHGWIDWSWSAQEIERFICAFDDPYAGASTMHNGLRVHVKKASLANGESLHSFQRGLIFRKDGGDMYIAAKDGIVVVRQLEGASPRIGDRLYTPAVFLADAMQTRVIFNSRGKAN